MGKTKSIPLEGAVSLQDGIAEGVLQGGNLACFSSLIGSKDMPGLENTILFFEDVNEHLSRIDRYLCSFKRAGLFKNAKAIIFGQFSGELDGGRPFGFTLEDIIREHTDGLHIPVLMNAPFGHGNDLPAFPIGATVRLENKSLHII